jgi:hypothetical protein
MVIEVFRPIREMSMGGTRWLGPDGWGVTRSPRAAERRTAAHLGNKGGM